MAELNIGLPSNILDGTQEKQKIYNNLAFLNDKIWISTASPAVPYEGQFWWDVTNNILKVWNGTAWESLAGASSSPVFAGLTINGNIICTGTVDGTDISVHVANASAHHALVTVAGAPLTIIGQAITFNYDGADFQLSGNNLQVKDGGVSHSALADLNSANYTHLTATNHTDLTDGGATTLHKHDHGGMDGLTDDDHTQYLLRQPSADVVINEAGGDFNLRIEGDTNINLLFLDAGLDKVCIGGATPNEMLTVDGILSLKEGSAPSATANYGKLYVKAYTGLSPSYLNHLWYMDELGTEYDLTAGGGVTDHGELTGLADDDHAQYILVTGTRAFTGDTTITATKKLFLGGDTYIVESAGDILDIYVGNANIIKITEDVADKVEILGADLEVDATKKIFLDAGGDSYIVESGANIFDLYVGGTNYLKVTHASTKAEFLGCDLEVDATKKIYLDGGSDTYITESAANIMDVYIGGTNYVKITHASTKIEFLGCHVEMDNGKYFYIDGGSNTYFTEYPADVFQFICGGSQTLRIGNPIYCYRDVLAYWEAAVDLGDASNYWIDVNYKNLLDRGCLGDFDIGVELQDGSIVSDLKSICEIKKRLDGKLTSYGVPMLDYRTFPKVSYRKADRKIGEKRDKKELLPRDDNDNPIGGEDGIEMTSMFSIFIGAFKEISSRIEQIEEKIRG